MKVNQNTSILFWLFKAKTSADGKSPIYCRITIEGKHSQFSTGKKITPELWDTKIGIAKGKSEETISINKELNKIRADLQRTYSAYGGERASHASARQVCRARLCFFLPQALLPANESVRKERTSILTIDSAHIYRSFIVLKFIVSSLSQNIFSLLSF